MTAIINTITIIIFIIMKSWTAMDRRWRCPWTHTKARKIYKIDFNPEIFASYLPSDIFPQVCTIPRFQGVTKICGLSWLNNSVLVYEPKCGGRGWGGCMVSANEYSCAHGVHINFGDLTPYLTYVRFPKRCTYILEQVQLYIPYVRNGGGGGGIVGSWRSILRHSVCVTRFRYRTHTPRKQPRTAEDIKKAQNIRVVTTSFHKYI